MGSDRDTRYVGKTHNFLPGTSAIGLAGISAIEGMEDDELLAAVRDVIKSTYGKRLSLSSEINNVPARMKENG